MIADNRLRKIESGLRAKNPKRRAEDLAQIVRMNLATGSPLNVREGDVPGEVWEVEEEKAVKRLALEGFNTPEDEAAIRRAFAAERERRRAEGKASDGE